MKHTIEWHENCLKNQESSIEGLKKTAARLAYEIDRQERLTNFYRSQVERAKREGRAAFDRETYNVKKGAGNG